MTSSHSEKQNSSQPPTIIQDERFNKLHFDPRFQKIPKTRRKLKIDQRFKRMFTDRSFSDTSNYIFLIKVFFWLNLTLFVFSCGEGQIRTACD
jgi:hypothetical protein